jgi:hypothetical protein
MLKSLRHIIVIVCCAVSVLGYSGMQISDFWQKINIHQAHNKDDSDSQSLPTFHFVSSSSQLLHIVGLPDFQPVYSETQFIYSLAEPVRFFQTEAIHQVFSKSLLSYFSRLYRSSIQEQAP